MNKEIKLCAFADEASTELSGQIDALKRNGIGLLEIRGVDKENIKDISYDKIKEIKKQLDANGIKVWSLGSPVGKYKLEDDFCKQLDEFKKLCEFCDILECQRIRMFSFYSKDRERVFDRLESFVNSAPEGVILCHENEKDIFGDDIEGCVSILKEFPQIKAVFDPANFVQCGVDTLEAWEKLSEYVDYMHIKDALKDKRVVKAGVGIGNVEKLIKMYSDQGGSVLTLEPHLMEFHGLSALENGQSINHIETYANENVAFDAGVSALKNILDRLDLRY